mmetsp:Transcript_13421/g.25659  ORF Transcript_13421/g.25659 Transcript_13421/m.25659 type:complete len:314 (+) Transcript_13421:212-1153(+)
MGQWDKMQLDFLKAEKSVGSAKSLRGDGSAKAKVGVATRGSDRSKTNFTDDECYAEGLSNTDSKYRSKIRMLAFVKDTVGESVVKDIPEWVIKCLVKIDKERWSVKTEANARVREMQHEVEVERAGMSAKLADLHAQVDTLAGELEEEREQRRRMEEEVEALEDEDHRKGGVIATMERMQQDIMAESQHARSQVAHERQDLENKRRQFFLNEIKDMTSTLKHLRSASSPEQPRKQAYRPGMIASSPMMPTTRELLYETPSVGNDHAHDREPMPQAQYTTPQYKAQHMLPAHTYSEYRSPAPSLFTPHGYNQRY